jgi:hypothetical protein
MRDLLELAWGVIANAGFNEGESKTPGWHEAAVKWRDSWHEFLAESPPPAPTTETQEPVEPSCGALGPKRADGKGRMICLLPASHRDEHHDPEFDIYWPATASAEDGAAKCEKCGHHRGYHGPYCAYITGIKACPCGKFVAKSEPAPAPKDCPKCGAQFFERCANCEAEPATATTAEPMRQMNDAERAMYREVLAEEFKPFDCCSRSARAAAEAMREECAKAAARWARKHEEWRERTGGKVGLSKLTAIDYAEAVRERILSLPLPSTAKDNK